MRIIGDVHGNMDKYTKLLKGAKTSVQVGDFGYGFIPNHIIPEYDPNHRFIRGNHDNPQVVRLEPAWIPDGTIEGDTMYIGGAWSIDWGWRTPGLNWWFDEECSENEFDLFIEKYADTKPRVMITHDCPTSIAIKMVESGFGMGSKTYYTRTGEALQKMYEIHEPEFHFFGHWHRTTVMKRNNTHFFCIGEFDFVDFDGEVVTMRDGDMYP
jgi:predicted phosphodiesterase